jgi:hypothetical protein
VPGIRKWIPPSFRLPFLSAWIVIVVLVSTGALPGQVAVRAAVVVDVPEDLRRLRAGECRERPRVERRRVRRPGNSSNRFGTFPGPAPLRRHCLRCWSALNYRVFVAPPIGAPLRSH